MAQQQSIGRFFSANGTTAQKLESKPASSNAAKRSLTPSLDSSPKRRETVAPTDDTDPTSEEDRPTEPQMSTKEEVEKLIELGEVEHAHHKNEKLMATPSSSKLPYSKLTSVFEEIEAESGRLKMISIISEFYLEVLQQSTVDKLVKIVYLSINRLGPDYEPDLELGLGETLLIKAISECYGRASSKIKQDYKTFGDLGLVAQQSRSGQPTMFKPTPLDVDLVFDSLTKIAKSTGKDSQMKKVGLINKLLTACERKTTEAKFLIRSLEGKLRIGLAEKTVLIGLAQAFTNYENHAMTPENITKAEDIIRESFSLIPNYEIIIKTAYEHGIFNLLDHIHLTPGIPLKPMLAKPTKSISEVLDRFQGEEFTCEYKYDGERAQVHLLSDGSVRIYSRNSEDMSQRYPDLIAIIKDFIKVQEDSDGTPIKSLILDCEAVAWDRQLNKILPFQVLSTRKRKDVNEKDIKVHICLFAFDILYLNGESVVNKTLAERRELMYENLKPIEGKFCFATSRNSSNLDELQIFLDQSVKDSCEGLMVKMLNSKESYYEPSKRSRNWLKLKKDYLAGVGDSLDLVVVGAYNGRGKRTGNYGGFLLASYNDDTGEFETTCKIGTGFSDEDLTSLYNSLHPTEISQPKGSYVYDPSAVPDVWFEPTTLFEVLTADLSLSPIYKAGHQEFTKGISLRFPRFLRIREDKGVEDATTSEQVIEFYSKQASVQS
ncbi:ATP-dependent DNA ligase Cdc17 [Yamadazyma tenuis]|uniref:DNA ligase n=1 Tax=Candida tenuis (strain ATCC 10573 / BCRC 21748 / CBS 615 / JCM 9827 / NBRC 10315 / NRRL Y-1498 / VKM Y-70) TaxID=590646 RepID=G3B3P1_CANTC|nr:ATP-dependent DNA ligase [Yamadazyma tenuis ATCC 10573]EGV64198.1 ATP-dependent DNA ligase [Yamadazyma tenuis ATCC 10573]WEJ96138.1 ATP-dependent DNA ligase Cdc17 [Yamadazyma tenuis]